MKRELRQDWRHNKDTSELEFVQLHESDDRMLLICNTNQNGCILVQVLQDFGGPLAAMRLSYYQACELRDWLNVHLSRW